MNGVNGLIKHTQRALSALAHVRTSEKTTSETWKRGQGGWHRDLRLPASRTVGDAFLSFINLPVCYFVIAAQANTMSVCHLAWVGSIVLFLSPALCHIQILQVPFLFVHFLIPIVDQNSEQDKAKCRVILHSLGASPSILFLLE